MGKKLSRCCIRCFQSDFELESTQQSLLLPVSSQSPPSSPPTIELETFAEPVLSFPPLSKLQQAYEAVMKVVHAKGLEPIVSNPGLQVFGRTCERGYFIKTVWETAVPRDQVMDFIRKYEERPAWDPNLTECSLISYTNGVSLVYQRYKKVLTVSPRDMLLAIKTFPLSNAVVDVAVSIDLPDRPVAEGVVRAQVHMGGFFAETTDSGCTRVIAATEIDFGGVIPRAMMLRMSAMAMPNYIKRLMDGVKRHVEGTAV